MLSMRFLPPFLMLISAAPAAAQNGIEVSEPSSMALFALSVLGVLVGRQAAKRRADDDTE